MDHRRQQPATAAVLRQRAATRPDAVTAGLTLPWSSGVVEGHVNRIKMLKRQMYGRANPGLPRRRMSVAMRKWSDSSGESHPRASTDPCVT